MRSLGLVLFTLFLLVVLLAGLIAPHDPWERFEPFTPPGPGHWLGTNDIGNDILSELIHGSRVSLFVGLATAAIATSIGLSIGLLSGYFRGPLDEILMAMTDVFLMIPSLPLVIVVAAFSRPSYVNISLVLGLVWWTSTARVVRSQTLQVREMPFVTGDRTLGFSHTHILVSDVVPHIFHVLSPKFMLTVASAMISEASLSFLGLGDPSLKSWGMMIRYSFERGGFINGMWWWYVPPGLCITLGVLSIVLVGFSMDRREAGIPPEI